MSAGHITAYLSFGAAQTGVWCDACALPSAIEYDVRVLTVLGIGDPVRCKLCTSCDG